MSDVRRDLSELHPLVRRMVGDVLADIRKAKLPFEVFEAYRSPSRQRKLFNQGSVTKADAWQSYHQYGMAVDLVMKENGQWSWRTDNGRLALWEQMNAIGRKHGLEPLSWEKPHLQLAGTSASELRAGRYPPGGDESWANALSEAIDAWPKNAPPAPVLDGDRPRLPELAATIAGGSSTSEARTGLVTAEGTEQTSFERAQAVLRVYEGGYVDHPADKGGPTNFGITHTTLARWRGVGSVTAFDVEQMTYAEAKEIYFANYWSKLKCGAIPGPLALAVYNVGVHSGVRIGGEFLQIALNAEGAGLEVDGDVGPLTIGALARAEIGVVLTRVIDLYEARLRIHPRFDVFGVGFINRVSALKTETGRWLAEWRKATPASASSVTGGAGTIAAETAPAAGSTISAGTASGAAETEQRLARITEALRRLDPMGGLLALHTARTEEERLKAVRDIARRLVSATPELAPVNNALGSTAGSVLNGNKSLVGILGSVATALFAQGGPDSVFTKIAAAVTSSAPFLQGMSGPLLPIFIGIGVWGLLGKQEKWSLAQTIASLNGPAK